MRILMLNHNVARGGGTFYRALDFGRHLVRRGHDVTFLTISPTRRWTFGSERYEGVAVVHTPDLLWGTARSGWDPWDTLRRIGFLRNRSWDIVHAWDSRPVVILPALYARRRSRRADCKLVIDWSDWWGRGGIQAERRGGVAKFLYAPIETYFEEAFRRRADGATVISEPLYQRAIRLGVPPARTILLPQGCNVEVPIAGDRAAARSRLGLAAGTGLVVTLGKLLPSEAALLFETVRLLFVRRPDCRLMMIGNHQVQIPATLRADGRLVETGFVSDAVLQDYVAACDTVLMPLADSVASRARWPSKINLFLAAGRAPVLTRIGDLASLLEREGAAVVANCDPADLTDNLVALLDDAALRERCERRARYVAEHLLSWPLLTARLESFYWQLRGKTCTAAACP
jgi:glycosyltransferase involved in cell wall biosynthesis